MIVIETRSKVMGRFFFGLLVACCSFQQIALAGEATELSLLRPEYIVAAVIPAVATQPIAACRHKLADFKQEQASIEARQIADWVVDSNDNQSMPFVIVDKKNAKVFVFYGNGRLRGAAAALLGMAIGDDAIPGINGRKMANIRPEERITAAGRFVAALGRNLSGTEILWVDYDGAISLHRVITTRPSERRLERLASVTPLDNRISYGCINVPSKFYLEVVRPTFTGTNGIVYVLPETRSAQKVFGAYLCDRTYSQNP